jgi:hypothetical protein
MAVHKRRNWLFIGHPQAGWRAEVIYSVIGTCRLLGVNRRLHPLGAAELAAATNKTATGLLPHDFARLASEESRR